MFSCLFLSVSQKTKPNHQKRSQHLHQPCSETSPTQQADHVVGGLQAASCLQAAGALNEHVLSGKTRKTAFCFVFCCRAFSNHCAETLIKKKTVMQQQLSKNSLGAEFEDVNLVLGRLRNGFCPSGSHWGIFSTSGEMAIDGSDLQSICV